MTEPATSTPVDGHVVAVFLDAAQVAIDLIASEAVTERWDEPAALTGYRVGGLAAHLGRSITNVESYLDADAPAPGSRAVGVAEYFARALAGHDPVDSEFHRTVRARSERTADEGSTAVATQIADCLHRLRGRPLDPDRQLSVLDGIVVTLGDYLVTRIIELTVHGDDLAVSVGLSSPPFSEDAWRIAARATAEVLLARQPAREVVLGLSRAERTERPSAF